jgi:hypothetical protein
MTLAVFKKMMQSNVQNTVTFLGLGGCGTTINMASMQDMKRLPRVVAPNVSV